MLWRVHNTEKYFLGSLHFLPENDQQLDGRIWALLEKVSRVVFECDFSQWKEPAFGVYDIGCQLNDVVPPHVFTQCVKRWGALGIRAKLDQCKPWWAMQVITINTIMTSGFTAGVDTQLFARTNPAQRGYLESPEAYYLAMNGTPLLEQVSLLEGCCDEEKFRSQLNSTYAAWRASDLTGLSRLLDTLAAKAPLTLYATLGWRNRAWTPKIVQLLADATPTLFVMGALHYVGTDKIQDCLNDGHKYVFERVW